MIGSLCSQFHWTLDYILWELSWPVIQLILADMPWYDYDNKAKTNNGSKKEVYLSSFESSEDLKKYIEKLNGQ